MFPVAMSRPETAAVVCQDIIHRRWAFTRVLGPVTHPDHRVAETDITQLVVWTLTTRLREIDLVTLQYQHS